MFDHSWGGGFLNAKSHLQKGVQIKLMKNDDNVPATFKRRWQPTACMKIKMNQL